MPNRIKPNRINIIDTSYSSCISVSLNRKFPAAAEKVQPKCKVVVVYKSTENSKECHANHHVTSCEHHASKFTEILFQLFFLHNHQYTNDEKNCGMANI